MAKLSIEIPDAVVHQAQSSGDTIETVILKALNDYLVRQLSDNSEATDITQTQTWQLCGDFLVAESSQDGIPGVADLETMTNYTEQIDDVLYQGI